VLAELLGNSVVMLERHDAYLGRRSAMTPPMTPSHRPPAGRSMPSARSRG